MQVIELPFRVKDEILACGADLKGGFCFARGNHAYLSNGFGDLSEADNIERYQKEVERVRRKFKLKPKIIACDMHPEYFSTKFAQSYTIHYKPSTIHRIQHHHAHIASCMLDNGINGKVIGVSFDGTGYGTDGNIWGGEFLIADFKNFKRVYHIDYVYMPGGEAAIKEPWRMAVSYLYKAYKDRLSILKIPFIKKLDKNKYKVLIHMMKKNINSPLTSSVGRLFDGVASLIGLRDKVEYEAQAAIELEKIADIRCSGSYGSKMKIENIIKGIVSDLRKKEKPSIISSKFHNTIAYIVKGIVLNVAREKKMKEVVFSGGVFQNKYLMMRLKELFEGSKFKIYFHNSFSTTDASVCLGQVAIANTNVHLRGGRSR